MHEKILAIEEEIWQGLNIPYHVINIAAGDLGAPAAKKYDMEYWSPVNQKYQEITSCSNCTDLHVAVQLFQHHMLKRLSFLPFINISWPPLF